MTMNRREFVQRVGGVIASASLLSDRSEQRAIAAEAGGPRSLRGHDPALHLFLNDDEIVARERLYRMMQSLRKETATPVLAANGADEGTAIGYATVVHDAGARMLKLWYMAHRDYRVRLATSADGMEWTRRGFAIADPHHRCDNLGVTEVGRSLHPWFGGARWIGYNYASSGGLHAMKSTDGEHFEVKTPGIIPGAGDRSSLLYDPVADQYWLISRPSERGVPGLKSQDMARPRVANLWKSKNFVKWDDCGVVLRYDDQDDPDVEIYGMQPFRWGRGFLAFVEIYHKNIERLDSQLAYSDDGIRWHRMNNRAPVLPRGGEGAWDSHWAVPTFNPPIPWGDRLLVPYTGASTKHGSKERHRRGIGLASLRPDGWVSLEAGRTEGLLVTTALPLEKPMCLEVNANVYSGYLTAEVISAGPERAHQPLAGYEAEKSRINQIDSVRQRITWGERKVVEPVDSGRCHLRLRLYQGSLFSYRWASLQS
jgi:hypothetical protein